jgi:hypothetical protein
VVQFLAQPLYPEHRLNRRLGWPQRLSGSFEDERKLFSCLKLMDVKQAVAQQVQKLPTLHIAWTFILGLHTP